MGTTSEKLTYLNTTKTLIKDNLNLGGANISNEPFRVYSSKLIDIYKDFLANGTDVIWNNWLPKVTGSGETITLNNTIEAKMDFVYKGNTSQTGTPTPDAPIPVQVVSGDNTIKITGKNLFDKSTSEAKKFINKNNGNVDNSNNWSASDFIPIEQNTNYIYSGITNGWSGSAGTCFYDNNKTFISSISSTTQSFTTPNNAKYVRISLNTETPTQVQLEKGSIASDYEPYQGNTYNIDLPVENLFDKYKEKDNFFYNSSGTTTVSSGNYFINQEIPLNNTYTISYSNRVNGGGIYSFIRFVEYGANDSFIKRTQLENNNSSITLDTNTKKVIISVDAGPNAYFEDLQIEKGSKANSYTPYGTTPIELCKIGDYQDSIKKSTGKNLFDKDSISNGFLDESGIVGGDTSAYRTSDFIPILPNTAYYKTTTSSPRTKYYDKNKQPLNTTTYRDIPIGGNAGTFTTPSNAYYFRFSYPVTGVNANGIMINKGTTALPYEPYGNGDWYVEKKIGKVVLNGSEEWKIGGTYSGITQFDVNANTTNIPETILKVLSNYFRGVVWKNSWTINKCISIGLNIIRIMTSDYTTVADFKAWLSEHNTEVYYVLSTPTYTEITGELLNQLETIKKSYENQTNISQENNDKPFILDVTALKQLN